MKNKNNKSVNPVFETYAILDHSHRDKTTNVCIPSEQAVSDAKDWVDLNEK